MLPDYYKYINIILMYFNTFLGSYVLRVGMGQQRVVPEWNLWVFNPD